MKRIKIRRLIRAGVVGGAVLLGGAGLGFNTQATTITMNLNDVFETAGSPNTSGTLTATFQDVSGGVDLTLSVSGLAASYYNVNTWWFNVASGYANTLSAAYVSGSAGLPTSVSLGQGSSEAGTGGYFNLWYNNYDNNFVNGDSITYLLTSSVAGLTASDFAYTDSLTSGGVPGSGSYYAAAEIFGGDSGGTQLFYEGATGYSSGVPDGGTTLGFLGASLACVWGLKRKIIPARS